MTSNIVLYLWQYDTINNVFNRIYIIDTFISLIWINRYYNAGNFELYIPASTELFALLTSGEIHYITRADKPDNAMKVEKVELSTGDENGDHITITGRSIECILSQRVFLETKTFESSGEEVQRIIVDILKENVMRASPYDVGYMYRKIPIFSYDPNLDEPKYIEPFVNIDIQFNSETILDAVVEMCKIAQYGFKITFSPTALVFYLYVGLDRTINQTTNKRVVFSPDYNNLANTTYSYDITSYFNACLALGDGNGYDQARSYVFPTYYEGINLYETALASGVSKSTESGELNPSAYEILLRQWGTKEIKKADVTKIFSADILNFNAYTYGIDYNLGDMVTAINEYGISGSARVTEISEVFDESGYKIYPTLSEWSV